MYHRLLCRTGFKPWHRYTAKCARLGCDSYKERRWLLNPVRLFCRGWFRRHVLRTI